MSDIRYVSTRGEAPALGFEDVLLTGLARDGGLYVPATWPKLGRADIAAMRGLGYAETAERIMRPFVGNAITRDDFAGMVSETYAGFDHPAVAPLKQLGPDQWLMELFHGPTLAFKDYPLQLVGRLFEYVLKRRGRRVTIVGATSGDTGSAAIEACRDKDAIDIFILHPKGRVSDVQRRQMTTVTSPNVHNVAVEGTFDDCQAIVKKLFADMAFRDKHGLSAVNSINWARIMAQTVYYFVAGVAVGAPDRRLAFAVPTGNFGNVYSGYAARKMGLGIDRFVVATNANDILARYLSTGEMAMGDVVETLSPSMDIQVSSNFERLLYDYCRHDGHAVAAAMGRLARNGRAGFGKARWRAMTELFEGHRVGDNATTAAIADIYGRTGELVDPHSAIGIAAGQVADRPRDSVLISLATAHPAKFPRAVAEATDIKPELPGRLSDLMVRPEHFETLPNDAGAVGEHIAGELAGVGPPTLRGASGETVNA